MIKRKKSTCLMALGLMLSLSGSMVLAGPGVEKNVYAASVSDVDAQWEEVQSIISQYYGEWKDESYSGAYTDKMPDTAILGNGDVGITSAGKEGVKTFLVSKSDFWSSGNLEGGYYGAEDNKTKPVSIGGINIQEKTSDDAEEEENLAVKYSEVSCSNYHDNFKPERAVNGTKDESGYEGWVSKRRLDSTTENYEEWLQVKFDNPMTVQRFVVKNDGYFRSGESANNTRELKIQYGEDGTNWTDAIHIRDNTDNVINCNLEHAVTANYFRVLVLQGTQTVDGNSRARIGQFEMYRNPGASVTPDPGQEEQPYYEKQDILNAEILTDTNIAGVPVSMATWMQADENILVTELTSKGSTPAEMEVETWVKADNRNFPVETDTEADRIIASRSTYNGAPSNENSWTSKASLVTEIVGADKVDTENRGDGKAALTFTLNPGETVYVITAVGGGGKTYDKDGRLQNKVEPEIEANMQLDQLRSTDELKKVHQNWWKDYWMASYIDLQGQDLIEKYYYGAQYILGCTARDGKTAPGLYGVWHTTDTPSWSSDYHLNYNFIATYYGANSSNRSELTLPAGQVFLDLEEEGTRRAGDVNELKRINGDYVSSRQELQNGIADALLLPVGVGPWGTVTDDTYLREALCASYSSYPMLQYYKYTKDQEYLKNGIYDYLKKCAAFYETWLERSADGSYTLYAGYNEGSWAKNPAVELAAVKNLMKSMVQISRDLGVDEEKRALWQQIYDGLSDQPVTTVTGKQVLTLGEKEWTNNSWLDLTNPIPGDGNAIPLDAVIPGGIYNFFSSKEDLEIVRNTVDVFSERGAWTQINNFPRLFTEAVTAHYPAETVVEKMTDTIRQQLKANLRISDNTHGVEKSGATEAVNRMLLASADDMVEVFPNWIKDTDAKFVRLKAENAFLLSSEYNGETNEVEYINIESQKGETMNLVVPWKEGAVIRDEEGNPVEFTEGCVPSWKEKKLVSFETKAGETYIVEKFVEKPLTGISLDRNELYLETGRQAMLNVTYLPTDTTDAKEVIWSSSDKSAAIVENGTVTAIGAGNAVITAVSTVNPTIKAECAVVVTDPDVQDKPGSSDKTEKPPVEQNPAGDPVQEGKVYANGNYWYKVTSLSEQTVSITGLKNKKITKLKVCNTVKLGGKSYKVTGISASAFKGNKKITSVTGGKYLTSIGNRAFESCTRLTGVTFSGKTLKMIGTKAFGGCGKLKSIKLNSTVLKKVGTNAFKGIQKKAVIKVPASKYKAYCKLLAKKGQSKTVRILK